MGRSFAESLVAECTPPVDVYETDERVEVVVDLPGVDDSQIRVIARGSALLVAGEKASRRGRGDSSFHLVERDFGRFARTVRLSAPCDTSKATARLVDGELRIVIPKITDRRGNRIPISVAIGAHSASEGSWGGMRILFIGDIVGRPGRDLVKQGLPALVDAHHVDLVIANA